MGLILIDLQIFFDTVDQDILLDKMGCIGFSEKVISGLNCIIGKKL